MFNKFCLIFTLILLSYSNLVYSNPKNTIGEDQKTVNILNNYFSKQTIVGKANFQFLFWNMYDAKLISESGSYPSNKFALILKYNKDFSKKSVVYETINQLKKQKTFNEKELKEVNALLNKAFREIKKNNKFIGIKNNDEAIFYFQNENLKKLNHEITPKEILKQRKSFRGPAIIRNIYSEILNVLQVTVMKKQKQKKINKRSKKLLDDAMMTSIAGISAAIKNTG